jgi:hypothetical protein
LLLINNNKDVLYKKNESIIHELSDIELRVNIGANDEHFWSAGVYIDEVHWVEFSYDPIVAIYTLILVITKRLKQLQKENV